jgi:DNA-binding MarR family transcriptional regulator
MGWIYVEIIILANGDGIKEGSCKSAKELEELDEEVEGNKQLYLKTWDEKYLEEAIKLTLSWKPKCTLSYLQRHLYAPEAALKGVIEKLRKEGYISLYQ